MLLITAFSKGYIFLRFLILVLSLSILQSFESKLQSTIKYHTETHTPQKSSWVPHHPVLHVRAPAQLVPAMRPNPMTGILKREDIYPIGTKALTANAGGRRIIMSTSRRGVEGVRRGQSGMSL